jgi:hypothetical protein
LIDYIKAALSCSQNQPILIAQAKTGRREDVNGQGCHETRL